MNDKALKLICYIILGVLVAQSLFQVFGMNKNLNNALKELKESQESLNQAREDVNRSKLMIDTLRRDLKDLGVYANDIRGRVYRLDLDKRGEDTKGAKKIADIKEKIDSVGKAFPVDAELPVIVPQEFQTPKPTHP